MARRASSGVNTKALLSGAGALVLLLGGAFWFINRDTSGFDAPPLSISREIDQYRSLAGNTNTITGILHKRPPTKNAGQMATLKDSENNYIFIIIPEDFKGGNLNLQDEYTFLVKFNTDGVPVALDVTQN